LKGGYRAISPLFIFICLKWYRPPYKPVDGCRYT